MNIIKRLKNCFRTNSNGISYKELEDMRKRKVEYILLDVRSVSEYNEGHLEGALLIPLYELKEKVENIIKDKERIIIVYCQVGKRSQKAIGILKKLLYKNVYQLRGGLDGNNITFL